MPESLVADPAVGKWDQELFDRFRAAAKGRRTKPGAPLDPKGALRRRLKQELLRINAPLIKRIVHQVQGKAPPDGRARSQMHLVGAGRIEWDVAMNLGLFAGSKALETLDQSKGSFSGYLLKKVFYELQCEVGRMNMIRVDRGARPMGLDYLEDDEQLGRLDLEDDEAPRDQLEELEELEERTGEPIAMPTPTPTPTAFALAVAGVAIVVAPVLVLHGPDLRLALDVFIEDHCRFAPGAHVASSDVSGRYRVVVASHGEIVVRSVLEVALRAHGVRPQTMRVPWWPTPVRGLIGLALHSRTDADSGA